MRCVWNKKRVVRAVLGLVILANAWALFVWTFNIHICVNLIGGILLGVAYNRLTHHFWHLWRFV